MTDTPRDEHLAAALGIVDSRQESPTASLHLARDLVARDDLSDEARVVALWAQGLAERELNLLDAAETHLRAAIEVGEATGHPVRAAQVMSALVSVVGARGRPDEALELADEARAHLPSGELADLDMKRAVVLEMFGRFGEAADAYTEALSTVAVGHDRVLEARLRCNRAVAFGRQGRTSEALRDTELAERLALENGQTFLAAGAAHNHGYTAGLQGDVVTALESFARAEALYAGLGFPGRSAGVLASDRCEVMLVAGLYREARENALAAVDALEFVDDVSDLAEARLLLARACLADGDVNTAREAARAARTEFRATGRTGWATIADFLAFTADEGASAIGDGHDAEADEAIDGARIADDLEQFGWSDEAAAVRLSLAEMAWRRGDDELARRQLDVIAPMRRGGRVQRRASAWFATAQLRLAVGDRRGAKRALGAGIGLLQRHQATLGATDLRVGASVHAARLARMGLGLALDDGRPRDVLVWSEHLRANALAAPAVRPPDDAALSSALTDLRRVRTEYDEARRAGEVDPTISASVSLQERRVRDLARLAVGGHAVDRLDVARLADHLGDRQLVEYVEHDGALAAVIVSRGRCRVRRLGPLAPVAAHVDNAVFALGRLARAGASPATLAAFAASLDDALSELDRLLIAPLGLADADVVIVPTGALHALPWGGMPSIRARPVSVATSARRWRPHVAADESAGGGAVAVVAGPDLVDVRGEVDGVLASRPGAISLSGGAATVAAVLDLLERSDTAHLACHGTFRTDSPMFSSLAMFDGPLTVYDIESLERPPSLVVLPACNAGLSAVSAGDEVIGTTSALLGAGVRTVIAPITIVNDAATVGVMRVLHAHLGSGSPPSEALALVRDDTRGGDPAADAAAIALLCLV
ncbi:MAG: CHAT domain-containing tetratricopeptide repeat protein [Ilumatobacteraceae bacterium]